MIHIPHVKLSIKLRILIAYVFSLLTVIPFFSSEVGIGVAGAKLNLADLMVFIYICMYIRNLNRWTTDAFKMNTKYMFILLFLYIFMIPIGIINDGKISESIRLIRNMLYIPATCLILYRNIKKDEVSTLVIVISIASAGNVLFNSIRNYYSTNWFSFYRANGVLNVVLFCFCFFEILDEKLLRKKLLNIVACGMLFMACLFSQERLELITITASCLFTYYIRKRHKKRKLNINKIKKVISSFVVIFVLLIVFTKVFNIDVVSRYIDYYFTYRLKGGDIFSRSGLSADQSGAGRLLQVKTVLKDSSNIIYILIGRGTCAHYYFGKMYTCMTDSAALWVYKDLGILGLLILALWVISLFKIPKQNFYCTYYYSLKCSCIGIVLFMIYNPSFTYTQTVDFAIGLYISIKMMSIEGEFQKIYIDKKNKEACVI